MNERTADFYEFGDYRIDVGKRILLRAGESVRLTPKVFDTLLVLVENHGKTLAKDELMMRLWRDQFVEESNLTENISKLRKALGDKPGAHRLIVTVPKGGYCFVGDVREIRREDEVLIHERTRRRVQISHRVVDEEIQPLASPSAEKIINLEEPISPARKNKFWRNPLFAIVLAAFCLLMAVFGLLWITVWRGAPQTFEKIKLAKLTTSGKIVTAAISPDGKNFVYAASEAGAEGVWLRQTSGSGNAVNIVAPAPAVHYHGLTFAPDGNSIYFLRSGGADASAVFQIPILGGAARKILADADSPPAVSPDGKRLAFLRGLPGEKETALIIADADSANEQKAVALGIGQQSFVINAAPAWSADGKQIACAVKDADESGDYQTIAAVKIENGALASVTAQKWQRIGQIVWQAAGKDLFFTAADSESALPQQIWRVRLRDGKARQITADLNDYRFLSLTSDGKTIAAVQIDTQTNLFAAPETDAAHARQISESNYDGRNGLAASPDGTIIYTVAAGGNQNLWVIASDGGNPRQLTDFEGVNRFPSVSPDGRLIAFSSNRAGGENIWLMNSDGSRPRRLTFGTGEIDSTFSPDGKWIIYKSYVHGIPNLWRISTSGGEPQRFTDKISGLPAVSPDGRLLACFYRENAAEANRLAILPFEGGAPIKIFDLPIAPMHLRWTPDGNAIAFVKTANGVSNIWQQPLDGAEPKQFTDFKAKRIFYFDWTPDGKQLIVSQGVSASDVILISDAQ